MPRRMEPDPPLPAIITYEDALDAGLTRDQVRHRVRSGRWKRVGTGVFVMTASLPRFADRFALERRVHVNRATAALGRYPGSVVAFESAVVEHGLSIWSPLSERPAIIVPEGHPRGSRALARLRHVWLPNHHVMKGRVTTPTRTWVDVARVAPLADALTVADEGLRTRMFTLDGLARMAEECGALIGARKVDRALCHVNGLRESPLESASWAYFVRYRLPLPRLQVTIRDDSFVARVDYLWDSARLIGECDGLVKYRSPDDLVTEKWRQDRLQTLGYDVLRWGARDLMGPQLAWRIRDALRLRV